MAKITKTTYVNAELDWAEQQLASWKAYVYANPLPNVLMLTGIVVSAATTAVALAIVIRIYQKYGTIEEGEIIEKEIEFEREEVT